MTWNCYIDGKSAINFSFSYTSKTRQNKQNKWTGAIIMQSYKILFDPISLYTYTWVPAVHTPSDIDHASQLFIGQLFSQITSNAFQIPVGKSQGSSNAGRKGGRNSLDNVRVFQYGGIFPWPQMNPIIEAPTMQSMYPGYLLGIANCFLETWHLCRFH